MDADPRTLRERLVEPVAEAAEDNVRADRAETPGPHPVMRGAVGLLLGLAAGALAALLTPRPDRSSAAPDVPSGAAGRP